MGRLVEIAAAILLAVALAACSSTFSKLKRLEPGMTFAQVDHIMGAPDSSQMVTKEGSLYSLYRYDHRLCNPDLSFWEKCDFYVIFRNGGVLDTVVKHGESYGPHPDALYLFERRAQ